MKNNKIRQRLYLAALLSDIGRFYMRGSSDVLSQDNLSILDNPKRYTYLAWSYQFLCNYLKNDLQVLDMGQVGERDSVFQFLKDSCKDTSFIRKAEKWALGVVAESGDKGKAIPLKSIFSLIWNGTQNTYIPPSVFDIKSIDRVAASDDVINDYAELWAQFVAEIPKLPKGNIEAYTESLLFLMKKYLWSIPVSVDKGGANFVDLYNHSKTKASITDCLYMTENITEKLLLVGGDVSGIQKYIYNIASRKAAVSLKGRSFYVQLLVDTIIQKIIHHEDIDVSNGHVLYSSGGKFYLILPNSGKVQKALESIKSDVDNYLWTEQNGQLFVNLSYVPLNFADDDFERPEDYGKKVADVWAKLNDNFNKLKYQKFKSILSSTDSFVNMFEPQSVSEDAKVCAVTGIEGNETNLDRIDKDNDSPFVLKSVKEQTKLGKTLKDADFILTHKGVSENLSDSGDKRNFDILGTANYIFDKKQLSHRDTDVFNIKAKDTTFVKAINNVDFLDLKLKGLNVGYGFQFYGGNKQAISDNGSEPKTFDKLADDSYLGILRMDVDNLGKMFIEGVNDCDRSLSSNATLSFLLDFFFSGYLNTIRYKECYRNNVNILYSGGDDVFAVGRWDLLINFAEDVRNEFRNFVGRDDISISAGISIVGKDFPIAKAAQIAGDAENASKKYRSESKNSFTLFGETLSWEDAIPDFSDFTVEMLCKWIVDDSNFTEGSEYAFVKASKSLLFKLVNNNLCSKALLHRLMLWYGIRKDNESKEKNDEKPDYSYYWHTAYYLSRFVERLKDKNKVVYDFCRKDLVSILYKSSIKKDEKSDYYRLMATAARWAELELRFDN